MSIHTEIFTSPQDIADAAGQRLAEQVTARVAPVLGLATGSTPLLTYQSLVDRHRAGLSFSSVTTFNLDEYVGLPHDHPQSYHTYMRDALFDQIDIAADRIRIPDGNAHNPDRACQQFEDAIEQAGGVDLWLLGIGSNGHIAFNEPGCQPDTRTRVVDLAPETIEANSRFFDSPDDVPRTAITAGIATILAARKILLIACGQNKATAVKDALQGPVSPDCPASFLQSHSDCTFLLDENAASQLA